MSNSEFEKLDKRFSFMFKFVFGFIAFVLFATLAIWGAVAYLTVTKGPETLHRVERVVDAYTNKLEQENANNKGK